MAITVSADNAIAAYLAKTDPDKIHPGFLSYIANLTQVAGVAPGIARGIVQELADQRAYLKLIASENYCSLATQAAMGNLLTDKYAEGFPGTRFYEGCDNIDDIEAYAWLNLAAASGYKDAVQRRDELSKSMTADQVLDAQKVARERQKNAN